VLIRTDSGGGTHAFLAWLVGRRLHYSVGMAITEDMTTAILARRIGLCGVFPVGVSGRHVRDLRICAPQAMVQQSLTESLATAQGKVVPSTLIG